MVDARVDDADEDPLAARAGDSSSRRPIPDAARADPGGAGVGLQLEVRVAYDTRNAGQRVDALRLFGGERQRESVQHRAVAVNRRDGTAERGADARELIGLLRAQVRQVGAAGSAARVEPATAGHGRIRGRQTGDAAAVRRERWRVEQDDVDG